MQCHKCGYTLWSIASRECPECGESFKPSDYQFKPGAVVYCCPECKHEHHSIDSEGYLFPREQPCRECGHMMQMDQMILHPTPGNEDRKYFINPQNPWVLRKKNKTNLLKAWWQTCCLAIQNPKALITHDGSKNGSEVGFGFWAIHVLIVSICSLSMMPMLIYFVGRGIVWPELYWEIRTDLPEFLKGIGLLALVQTVASIGSLFMTIFAVLVLSMILQLYAGIVRGKFCDWGYVSQSLCFSSGVLIFTAIPIVGIYLSIPAVFWWSVSLSRMLGRSLQIQPVVLWPASIIVVSALFFVLVWPMVYLSYGLSNIQM